MQSADRPSNQSGFTITECLVLLATTAFILMIPCLAANTNRERMNRIVCLNNLRQMGVGSQIYAAEDPKGRLVGSLPQVSAPTSPPGDDLNWLYGYGPSRTRFVQDLKTFVCPATRNLLRTNQFQMEFNSQTFTMLVDLYNNAGTPLTPGHSYEVFGYWVSTLPKTLQNTATYRRTKAPLIGSIPGPSMIMLMHDAMDTAGGSGLQNVPNPDAGHGVEGGNMLFADGHAEWIGTKNWAYRWGMSQDTTILTP